MVGRSTMALDWALLVLRLGLGITFVLHGYPKLFPAGPEGFAGFLRVLGFPAPLVLAWIVALVEFAGGIAMIVGLLVRYAGAFMVIEMIVTALRVKMRGGVGFIAPQGTGWELDFLLLCVALALVLLGAGGLSLDATASRRRRLTA